MPLRRLNSTGGMDSYLDFSTLGYYFGGYRDDFYNDERLRRFMVYTEEMSLLIRQV